MIRQSFPGMNTLNFEAVALHAYNDTRKYFCDKFGRTALWADALDAVRVIDPTFGHYPNVAEFTERLLPWLDERRHKGQPPWNMSNGKTELTSMKIGDFLQQLEIFWLDDLSHPGPNKKIKTTQFSKGLNYKLHDFGNCIASTELPPNEWKVTWVPVSSELSRYFEPFISWLVVCPATTEKPYNTLHIIYDEEQLKSTDIDEHEKVTRTEKVYLHEFGHARTHLNWYLTHYKNRHTLKSNWPIRQLPNGLLLICTPALGEYYAWAYSSAVKSCIVSARSSLTRVLRNSDDEWKNRA